MIISFDVVIFKKIIETTKYIVIIDATTCVIIEITIYINNAIDLILINIEIIITTKSINAITTRRFQLTSIVK